MNSAQAAAAASNGSSESRTVYSRREARWGPVGYCSSSILGSSNGAISCKGARERGMLKGRG